MINGIIGRKIGMTQIFAADGTVTPSDGNQSRPMCRRAKEVCGRS
jgi:ribosomal protein L3